MESCTCRRGGPPPPPPPPWHDNLMDGWGTQPLRWRSVAFFCFVSFCSTDSHNFLLQKIWWWRTWFRRWVKLESPKLNSGNFSVVGTFVIAHIGRCCVQAVLGFSTRAGKWHWTCVAEILVWSTNAILPFYFNTRKKPATQFLLENTCFRSPTVIAWMGFVVVILRQEGDHWVQKRNGKRKPGVCAVKHKQIAKYPFASESQTCICHSRTIKRALVLSCAEHVWNICAVKNFQPVTNFGKTPNE